ncbi:MAG: hypothetical protein JSW70_02410 [Syntrophobacterales bacterium]|nr:MAG: hypothetical protein JSW70_02410 [Syntrophobacterales bacterium]
MVDIIKGRRKEISDSAATGIRLCGDEILYDRGGNTSEASCGYISANAGCQESLDPASHRTSPWAKGASIPRLRTTKGSSWKHWSEGTKVSLIKTFRAGKNFFFRGSH